MKRILILITITAFTMSAFAQRGGFRGGPPPAGAEGQRPDPLANLKAALNLTDAQVSAIQSLMQAQQTQSQSIMSDINTKRQTLEALLNGTSPNATDVGNAAIAVHAAEKQMQTVRENFLTDLKKQLTTDQAATLDSLIKAGTPIPGLGGPGGPGGPRGAGMRGPRPGGF